MQMRRQGNFINKTEDLILDTAGRVKHEPQFKRKGMADDRQAKKAQKGTSSYHNSPWKEQTMD